VFRRSDPSTDVLALRDEHLDGEPLLTPVWRDGSASYVFDGEASREATAKHVHALPESWTRPVRDTDPPRPRVSEALKELAKTVSPATSDTT
jgi:hypothetical protein